MIFRARASSVVGRLGRRGSSTRSCRNNIANDRNPSSSPFPASPSTAAAFATSAPSSSSFLVPPSRSDRVLLGCVSYDPAVATIWDGMRRHLRGPKGGVPDFDYVLFTNYEAQVAALLDGHVDVAWNGPVAHVMAEDLAYSRFAEGGEGRDRDGGGSDDGPPPALVRSVGMRDCDRDFRSVALVRKDCDGDPISPSTPAAIAFAGRKVATGTVDSPQGHVVPVDWIRHGCGLT